MKCTLVYWMDDGWYVGKIKEIPGIASQGETMEELKKNILDAYKMMMEDDADVPSGNFPIKEIVLDVA